MKGIERYFQRYFSFFRENPTEVVAYILLRLLELYRTWESLPYTHRSTRLRLDASSFLPIDIHFISEVLNTFGDEGNPYIESYLESKIFGYKDPWQPTLREGSFLYFPSLFTQILELDKYLHRQVNGSEGFSQYRTSIIQELGSPTNNNNKEVFIVTFDMGGSEEMQEAMAEFMLCLSDSLYHLVVRQYGGLLEITGGDGLICLFKDSKSILYTVMKILNSFAGALISFRVGVDYGNVYFGGGIFHYSRDLVDAVRIQGRAGENCCLISKEAFSKISQELDLPPLPNYILDNGSIQIPCWRSEEIAIIDRGMVNFKHNKRRRVFELLLRWQLAQISESCTAL